MRDTARKTMPLGDNQMMTEDMATETKNTTRIKITRQKKVEEIAEVDDLQVHDIEINGLEYGLTAQEVRINGYAMVDGKQVSLLEGGFHSVGVPLGKMPKEIREPLLKWAKEELVRRVSR